MMLIANSLLSIFEAVQETGYLLIITVQEVESKDELDRLMDSRLR
jgi:hypothetical protein